MRGPTDDPQYIAKTLRTGCLVAGFVVLVLLSYGQTWAIVPYLSGFALAVSLLLLMEGFIRRVFDPKHLEVDNAESKKTKRGRREAIWFLAFGLLKYPILALLIWYLVRVWNTTQLMVFCGGFLTLHLIIGMRAMGRALTQTRTNAGKG
jgi:archaellum biogenesis protein FlaJ (TadC family)